MRAIFLIVSFSSKPNASEPPVSKSRCSIEKIPYRVEHLLELGKADMETQVRVQMPTKIFFFSKFSSLIDQFQIMHGWNPLDKSVNIFVKGLTQIKSNVIYIELHRRSLSDILYKNFIDKSQ